MILFYSYRETNRCFEANCLCESEDDICRTLPYNRHCDVVSECEFNRVWIWGGRERENKT